MRGSKTRQKQLKMTEPHTVTNLCESQCLDPGATDWEGGSRALLQDGPFSLSPCQVSSPIHFQVHFLRR